MQILSDVLSVLILMALVGLIGVIAWIASACLKLKNEALRTKNRLEGPIKAGANLVTAAKGVVDQETVRYHRVSKRVTVTAGVVGQTADQVMLAASEFKKIDFEGAYKQSKEVMKVAGIIAAILRSAHKQGKSD